MLQNYRRFAKLDERVFNMKLLHVGQSLNVGTRAKLMARQLRNIGTRG